MVGGVGKEGEEKHQVLVEIFGGRAQGRHHMVENRQIWHHHSPSLRLQLSSQLHMLIAMVALKKTVKICCQFHIRLAELFQFDAQFGLQKSSTNVSSPSSCSP